MNSAVKCGLSATAAWDATSPLARTVKTAMNVPARDVNVKISREPDLSPECDRRHFRLASRNVI